MSDINVTITDDSAVNITVVDDIETNVTIEQGQDINISVEGQEIGVTIEEAPINVSIFGGEQTTSLLGQTFETINRNMKAYPSSLSFLGGFLNTVIYDLGGGDTITKTFGYSSGVISTIILSGSVPLGISIAKSFTYESGKLKSISYS